VGDGAENRRSFAGDDVITELQLDPLQQLIEVQALQRLKAQYFRYWDCKEFDNWLSLFLEDVSFEVVMALASTPAGAQPFRVQGKQALRETVIAMNAETRTVHRGHTPEIDLHSLDTASGIWAMDDIIERQHMTIHGHGYYHESYRKLSGEWRIASLRLTRLRYTTICR